MSQLVLQTTASAVSSVLPCIHNVADLEKELASLIRVRNRLTPDTASEHLIRFCTGYWSVDLNTPALYASATRPHTLDDRSVVARANTNTDADRHDSTVVERLPE
jgi:hypothetical protein